ncbi:hypothetical protein [Aeromonas dhakensis]|uniref:hypothetical protein n=1 Tax=Aeromonas dhakensis TaxID=196024 RepID=UPI0028916AB6|nr:hypothetical protein [Aeromonas dhakensis]
MIMIINLYLCGGKILALKSPGQWDFYANKTGTYLWILPVVALRAGPTSLARMSTAANTPYGAATKTANSPPALAASAISP